MEQTKAFDKAYRNKMLMLPFVVTLLAAVVLLASFFLPLLSVGDEYREMPDLINQVQLTDGLTVEDALDLSLLELTGMIGDIFEGTGQESVAVVLMAFFGAVGVFSVLLLIFTLCKRPIATMIFDLMTLGSFALLTSSMPKNLTSGVYQTGIAYYTYYIGVAVAFVGAIWMLVKKVQFNKLKKQAENDAAAAPAEAE